MSFTYSNKPGESDRDFIRFYTGDTSETEQLMTDEEIAWIISEYPDKSKRLAVAFRQCATLLARKPDKIKLGPQEEIATKRLEYYRLQADKLERGLGYSGIPPLPEYQSEKVFEKGMMENV